jgi:hypothetical protein
MTILRMVVDKFGGPFDDSNTIATKTSLCDTKLDLESFSEHEPDIFMRMKMT